MMLVTVAHTKKRKTKDLHLTKVEQNKLKRYGPKRIAQKIITRKFKPFLTGKVIQIARGEKVIDEEDLRCLLSTCEFCMVYRGCDHYPSMCPIVKRTGKVCDDTTPYSELCDEYDMIGYGGDKIEWEELIDLIQKVVDWIKEIFGLEE